MREYGEAALRENRQVLLRELVSRIVRRASTVRARETRKIFKPIEGGEDGYIHATAMCKVAGKKLNDYQRLQTTQDYLSALSLDAGIPVSKIVVQIRGRGDRVKQGTWVHPKVAIHLAQWLSPEFAVQVTNWVLEIMTGHAPPRPVRRHPKENLQVIATVEDRTIGIERGDTLHIDMDAEIRPGDLYVYKSWMGFVRVGRCPKVTRATGPLQDTSSKLLGRLVGYTEAGA